MSRLSVIHCGACSSCKTYAACVDHSACELVPDPCELVQDPCEPIQRPSEPTNNPSELIRSHGDAAQKTRDSAPTIARSHRIFHKTALWENGDEFLGIYMLRSGSAKSFTLNEEGDEHITKFHFAGDLLGLDGFNNAYNHTIEFLETSSVCFFSTTEINMLTKHSTHFRNTLFKSMSDELVSHGAISLCYSTYTSEQRVAMFLIGLSSNFAQRGQSGVEFMLSMTRTEIANYLGMAMETVSRVMRRLQAYEVIDVNQKMVKINDIETLKNCFYSGDCLSMSTVNNKSYTACHA